MFSSPRFSWHFSDILIFISHAYFIYESSFPRCRFLSSRVHLSFSTLLYFHETQRALLCSPKCSCSDHFYLFPRYRLLCSLPPCTYSFSFFYSPFPLSVADCIFNGLAFLFMFLHSGYFFLFFPGILRCRLSRCYCMCALPCVCPSFISCLFMSLSVYSSLSQSFSFFPAYKISFVCVCLSLHVPPSLFCVFLCLLHVYSPSVRPPPPPSLHI